jgi:hypothetical protein
LRKAKERSVSDWSAAARSAAGDGTSAAWVPLTGEAPPRGTPRQLDPASCSPAALALASLVMFLQSAGVQCGVPLAKYITVGT